MAREIDLVLVTELSRGGRSTIDLLHTLHDLEARGVSLVALHGMTFDLSTSAGRMMATVIAGLQSSSAAFCVSGFAQGSPLRRRAGRCWGASRASAPRPTAMPRRF